MALYRLDETGEAIHVDLQQWAEWYSHVDRDTLTIARHDIIEAKDRRVGALAVDVLKHPYHDGKVLVTIITRMMANETELDYPWHTGVLGEEPEYKSNKREQAMEAHKTLVNRKVKRFGGKVFI